MSIPQRSPEAAHLHAHGHLEGLRSALAVKGFTATLAESRLTVIAPVSDGPRLADEITCAPRRDDGGRLWFWTSQGKPIAEADHIIETAVIVSGMLRPTL